MKFYFSSINLWCNKNLVDLEFIIWEILKLSSEFDIQYFEDPADTLCEYVIVNTCWFLSTSREEAEMTIKKYDDMWRKIVIAWCYIQVADNDFLKSLKNLHKVIPFVDYKSIKEILWFENEGSVNSEAVNKIAKIWALKEKKLENFIDDIKANQIWKKAFIWKWDEVRAYINAPYGYEYLKIAEWCDNNCTFCIIPKIRWKQKSRPIEEIIAEAKQMIANWIREIILIAQDTTRYWVDNYGEPRLIELLQELEKLDWDFKYRLLYMYPDNLTLDHLDKIKKLDKFIPYFDIPFQHISVDILKKMGRYYDTNAIFEFLDYIKSNFKEYFLRTAFIIWFPWETDEDFEELEDFVLKYRFDSVALFEYHDEPLAPSSKLEDKITSAVAQKRIKKLDKTLQTIYSSKKASDMGKIFSGTLEWYDDGFVLVRREIRAPEIDELDEVPFANLLWTWDIEIGDRLEYKL
ncbi:MAG: MiaB-like protein tRNA modifying enzyme YliG, TIGR01125 [uncultured bacterium (gcode 4)]|uniref:MiaB-like protein tRNA modifying enzyme YliG, TIGR01125 n=1 Tax=uncultured bacterium (gcode 4) TaxID=1234023 RepID=K2FZM4_9BACT|nr:MAG: MiaB-like protein tRNA modifying enzyme YliG, TIGR01125 [uncultured bacterium (gcode 4)]